MLLKLSGARWLMYVIPAAQEAEIWRIMVQSQDQQIVCDTLSQKSITKRTGRVVQGAEFKPQHSNIYIYYIIYHIKYILYIFAYKIKYLLVCL
jgi:hypothetical protein